MKLPGIKAWLEVVITLFMVCVLHNKEKVTQDDKTRVISTNDGNCEWRRLLSVEEGGKNKKSFS